MNNSKQAIFSPLEKALLNNFQHHLPLSLTPYADMARELNVSEQEVITTLKKLQNNGVVSRIGPVFAPNTIGASTLAAMSVAAEDIETVAKTINAFEEVNHNYEREHHFNLWFVVTAENQQHLQQVLQKIEKETGYPLISLPMQEDYFIDLGFSLKWGN